MVCAPSGTAGPSRPQPPRRRLFRVAAAGRSQSTRQTRRGPDSLGNDAPEPVQQPQQLAGVGRLDQVQVNARLLRAVAVRLLPAPGDGNEQGPLTAVWLLEVPGELPAVHVRQAE